MSERSIRTKKQNKPTWRKIPGWQRVLVRHTKQGVPKKDRNGRIVYQQKRIKTAEWQEILLK